METVPKVLRHLPRTWGSLEQLLRWRSRMDGKKEFGLPNIS